MSDDKEEKDMAIRKEDIENAKKRFALNDNRSELKGNGGFDVERPNVDELVKALGYDQIKPLVISPNVQKDIDKNIDAFRELFEEELLRRYEEA